jgi:hypothetical protein
MLPLMFLGTAGVGFLTKKIIAFATTVGIGLVGFGLVLPGCAKESPPVVEEIRKDQTVLPDTTSQGLRDWAIALARFLENKEWLVTQADSLIKKANAISSDVASITEHIIRSRAKCDTSFTPVKLDWIRTKAAYDSLDAQLAQEIQAKLDILDYDSLLTTNADSASSLYDNVGLVIYNKHESEFNSLRTRLADNKSKSESLVTSYRRIVLDELTSVDSLLAAHNLAVVDGNVLDVYSTKKVTIAGREVKVYFAHAAFLLIDEPNGFYNFDTKSIVIFEPDSFIFSLDTNRAVVDLQESEFAGMTNGEKVQIRIRRIFDEEATHAFMDINGTLAKWKTTGYLPLPQLSLRANGELAATLYAIYDSPKPKLLLVSLLSFLPNKEKEERSAYEEVTEVIIEEVLLPLLRGELNNSGLDSFWISVPELVGYIKKTDDAQTKSIAGQKYREYFGKPLDTTMFNQYFGNGIKDTVKSLPPPKDSTSGTTKTKQPEDSLQEESSQPGSEPKPGFCETIHPDSTYLYLGVSYMRSGGVKEAIRHLNRAKELNPKILPEELEID